MLLLDVLLERRQLGRAHEGIAVRMRKNTESTDREHGGFDTRTTMLQLAHRQMLQTIFMFLAASLSVLCASLGAFLALSA